MTSAYESSHATNRIATDGVDNHYKFDGNILYYDKLKDVALIKLTGMNPQDLDSAFRMPNFVGWNTRFDDYSLWTTIGHPNGDNKKITIWENSTYLFKQNLFSYGDFGVVLNITGLPSFGTVLPDHGASGAGLFNKDNQLIGFLEGGDDNGGSETRFGLLDNYYYYPKKGLSVWEKLRPYLDPNNTYVSSIPSAFNPELIPDENFNLKVDTNGFSKTANISMSYILSKDSPNELPISVLRNDNNGRVKITYNYTNPDNISSISTLMSVETPSQHSTTNFVKSRNF